MKNILIIEDDINIAELERDYLKLNGYKADIAHDGSQGLQKAVSGLYDVIIVDLMLPNKNGYEIIKEVRKKLEVPVIVVSAKGENIDKIRGLDYGADDYLIKPFSPAELVARINSHIKRYERLKGNNISNEVIVHRGMEINTAAHKVFVNGKEVQLTTKEYELLLFLASNPEFIETLWGAGYRFDS
ncbi:MAG: response regulator transcription factor [Caulobacteraceae bacterium]